MKFLIRYREIQSTRWLYDDIPPKKKDFEKIKPSDSGPTDNPKEFSDELHFLAATTRENEQELREFYERLAREIGEENIWEPFHPESWEALQQEEQTDPDSRDQLLQNIFADLTGGGFSTQESRAMLMAKIKEMEFASKDEEKFAKILFFTQGKKSLKEVISILPPSERPKFRAWLIEAMFPENVIFTIDDDPFGSGRPYDIGQFIEPLLSWLGKDGLGASPDEMMELTQKIVRFYVIGDRMLGVKRPTGQFYDYRSLHPDRDPKKLPDLDGNLPDADVKKEVEARVGYMRGLFALGLSPQCFQFHEVVGHPGSDNGSHLIRHSQSEFFDKMYSFRSIMRAVSGDPNYQITHIRTTGGGGMRFDEGTQKTVYHKDVRLEQNIDDWNKQRGIPNLVIEGWSKLTDTGRDKGGQKNVPMTPAEMTEYYLSERGMGEAFIPLLHFHHIKPSYGPDFFDGLARGYLRDKYHGLEVKKSEIVVTPKVEAVSTPQRSYTVKKGDNLYAIGRRFGVTSQAIQKANGMGNSTIIQPNQVLIIPVPGSSPAPVVDRPTRVVDRRPGETLGQAASRRGRALKRPYDTPAKVAALKSRLEKKGIRTWSTGEKYEETGWVNSLTASGRTSLRGLAEHTVEGVIFLCEVLNYRNITLSGAAEGANGHTSGAIMGHAQGRKVDILSVGDEAKLRAYIEKNGRKITKSSDGLVYHFTLTKNVGGKPVSYDYEAIIEGGHLDIAVLTPGDFEYRIARYRGLGLKMFI